MTATTHDGANDLQSDQFSVRKNSMLESASFKGMDLMKRNTETRSSVKATRLSTKSLQNSGRGNNHFTMRKKTQQLEKTPERAIVDLDQYASLKRDKTLENRLFET